MAKSVYWKDWWIAGLPRMLVTLFTFEGHWSGQWIEMSSVKSSFRQIAEILDREAFLEHLENTCSSGLHIPELLRTLEVRCTGVFSSFVDLSHASWRIRPALREHTTSRHDVTSHDSHIGKSWFPTPACGDPLWSIPTPDTLATLLPGPTPPRPTHFILLHITWCLHIYKYI